MSEDLNQFKQEVNSSIQNLSDKVDQHQGELNSVLNSLVSAVEKVATVLVKQEAQEKEIEEINSTQKEQQAKIHELDKKADMAVLSERNIVEAAKEMKEDSKESNAEIKKYLGGALKWGAGIFASLIVGLVILAFKQ